MGLSPNSHSRHRRRTSQVNGNPRHKGNTDFSNRPYSGSLAVSLAECKAKKLDLHITNVRGITTVKHCENHVHGCSLVQSLGYSKTCAKCITRMLIDFMKQQRLFATQVLLEL